MPFDQKQYIRDYNAEHYVRISLDVPREVKEDLQKRAQAEGKSLTAYLVERGLATRNAPRRTNKPIA